MPAEAYGPSIGPVKGPFRNAAFLKACAGDRVPDSRRRERIAEAMNCVKCHNGKRRGGLNYPSGTFPLPEGDPLVHRYVARYGAMPPGATDLTEPEREALAECLKQEFYEDFQGKQGVFKAWMTNDECWSSGSP
jgi:hypothetical protein